MGSRCFSPRWLIDTPPAHHYELVPGGRHEPGVVISFDGERLERARAEGAATDYLMWHINQQAAPVRRT